MSHEYSFISIIDIRKTSLCPLQCSTLIFEVAHDSVSPTVFSENLQGKLQGECVLPDGQFVLRVIPLLGKERALI